MELDGLTASTGYPCTTENSNKYTQRKRDREKETEQARKIPIQDKTKSQLKQRPALRRTWLSLQ